LWGGKKNPVSHNLPAGREEGPSGSVQKGPRGGAQKAIGEIQRNSLIKGEPKMGGSKLGGTCHASKGPKKFGQKTRGLGRKRTVVKGQPTVSKGIRKKMGTQDKRVRGINFRKVSNQKRILFPPRWR